MNIQNLSIFELLKSIHSGSLKIADVASQTIDAMERCKNLNTIISTNKELIETNARKLDDKIAKGEHLPLHGIPFLVKDNIDTLDFPTTGGTPALANHQPAVDAGVISRLKDAGALIIGKANMHEIAFGITSNNAHTGAVHNPYDEHLIPGGSSGGSAAAVSADIVPVSLGSDTGGSNRIPASLCGVCGFRPSTGRYPGDGILNLSKTRDTVGIFAQSVSDIILVDDVLAGGASPVEVDLKALRFALPRDPFFKFLENETSERIESVLTLLASNGVTLVEINMKELYSLNDKISFPIALYETMRDLEDYLDRNHLGITLEQLTAEIKSPDVLHIMQAGQNDLKVPEEVYLEALNVHRPLLQSMYAEYFQKNNIDAMLYPTTPLTARPIGQDETIDLNGHQQPTFQSYVRNSDPSSNAGIPSLSIPAGLASNGLPVGLSIDGPVGRDDEVLAIGVALSSIIPPVMGPFL
ncbi:MAG: Asp-tRNA(Asn)/Glu-tRNA(Gln) amidotransferase A subunit family amidase [Gammaproteobacteria bacterium]|jgi:Asp-tRNA(Asn)/Glu-tRNA(Gln) amidotransferase A subunit family amidase